MPNFDAQLNLRKRHPVGRFHLLVNALQSSVVLATMRASLDVPYGPGTKETLDVFPASTPNAPVFIFIHGGYFRSLDKKNYAYMAKPLVNKGITVVVINYALAPQVGVEEIVMQNIQAFRWVRDNISQWHGDPSNILLCGHSVGAFLVAKILQHSWSDTTRKAIAGALLLSGIYDLTSLQHSYLNRDLKLTDQQVTQLSPMFGHVGLCKNTVVAVGAQETEEFIRQSKEYASKLQTTQSPTRLLLLADKNHYTVSRMLADKRSQLFPIIEQMFAAPG